MPALILLNGPPGIGKMYERLMRVIAARPATKIVRSADGRAQDPYRDFVACLDR